MNPASETGRDSGGDARRFTRAQHSGVLSTLSRRVEGFPFGSVAPFILDHAGRPVILISTLAEHTKNIDTDPRATHPPGSHERNSQGLRRHTVATATVHQRVSAAPIGATIAVMIDWSTCPAVERDPARVSGAWLFCGTRVPVAALFENLEDDASIHQFVEWFPGVSMEQARTVLEHAARSALAVA